MASSSSSAVHFSRQTEPEMKSSEIRHWSNLSYNSSTSSHWSAETNLKEYNQLKKHPEWGSFFTSIDTLELGQRISGGAQADVYEARTKSDGPFNLVAKVMKGDASLQAYQSQWPIGMLSAYNSVDSYVSVLPLLTIRGGTLLEDERLEDERLKGRFAFVMYRRWGDLRLLIDRRMKLERATVGPFFMDQVIHLMLRIAEDMEGLHKHDILHRDLKASNVLVWGEFGDNMTVVAPSKDEKIGSVVADFECSVGVVGTRLWRAPEILQQLRRKVPSSDWELTRACDVYSYGMTCYEIVCGHVPFEDLPDGEAIDEVLSGRRPNLPDELPSFLRSIILGCWQSAPEMRPNFSDICMMLKDKQCWDPPIVVVDNESNKDATIIKVEQWDNHRALPLLEALERLLQMQLWVCKYAEYSLTKTPKGMIVQCFAVRYEGRKVSDENLIANIVKVLRTSHHSDAVVGMYLILITSERRERESLVRLLFFLKDLNFQVYKPRFWSHTHTRRFEGAMYVKGNSMSDLMQHFLEYEGQNIYIPQDCKMVLQKLASKDANLDLQRVEFCDLRAPRRHPAIRIQFGFAWTHMVIKVVCLENQKLLANTACSLVNLIREDVEPRGYLDVPIQVQKLKKEGVNGTYFDDDDVGEGRVKDFVNLFLKPKWDKWDNCLEYVDHGIQLNHYLDNHLRHGELELVLFFNDGFKPDDLMRILWKNGLHISRALREPHGNKKVLVTLFVSSENK